MEITYIHHSGYLLESPHALFLFDFVDGTLPPLDPAKELFVFVSHRHADHFSPKIFDLPASHAKTHFILSSDIRPNKVPESVKDLVSFMKPHQVLEFPKSSSEEQTFSLCITTFKSTDEGVAFILEVRDPLLHEPPANIADSNPPTVIYHAGDLNDWRWREEPLAWNNNMSTNYKRELQKIRDAGFHPDIAMIPLDGRQEDLFYLGVDEFMQIVGADQIFPMHFWEDFSVIPRLKALPCSVPYRARIMELKKD
ncbi:MBL fold metallo-hydrolase [Brotaphodocola sp.]|uniref:MBL fold metallo-hydrolase n=1 Tax=Brotaphodocola sp. TaxID=3073577 RepID=UPI003D7D06D1